MKEISKKNYFNSGGDLYVSKMKIYDVKFLYQLLRKQIEKNGEKT